MKNVLTGVRIELGVSGADSFETDKSQNPKESILHGYEHYCLRLLFEGNLHMRNRKYFFIADLSYIFSWTWIWWRRRLLQAFDCWAY